MASPKLPATAFATALRRLEVHQALNDRSLMARDGLSLTRRDYHSHGHPGWLERSRPIASPSRFASIRPVRIPFGDIARSPCGFRTFCPLLPQKILGLINANSPLPDFPLPVPTVCAAVAPRRDFRPFGSTVPAALANHLRGTHTLRHKHALHNVPGREACRTKAPDLSSLPAKLVNWLNALDGSPF
jgi:hypothetical protein